MKSAFLLFIMCLVFFSCGKDNNCRSREHMALQCRAVNQPTYGYQYAQEMCNRDYSVDRCYQYEILTYISYFCFCGKIFLRPWLNGCQLRQRTR